jgi:hypothetical protein
MPSGRDRGSCTLRITRGAEAAFMAIFPVQRRSIFRIKTDIFRSDCGWKRSVYPHSTGISGPRRTATVGFRSMAERDIWNLWCFAKLGAIIRIIAPSAI